MFVEDLTHVGYEVVRGVAVVTIKNPPVNSLGFKVRYGLTVRLRDALSDPAVTAIVLIGGGKTFPAGADIAEFPALFALMSSGKEIPNMYFLPEVIASLEASNKPVISAIHGNALGGGLEVCLGTHYRIALESAKMGLPEVQLGLLPGGGGTQRLPRVVDLQTAITMISSGRSLKAPEALKKGLIDHIVPGKTREALLAGAIEYASVTAGNGIDLVTRRLSVRKLPPIPDTVFDGARKMAGKAARGFKAPLNCISAVEAAFTAKTFTKGMRAESKLFNELIMGTQAKAQQYFFFAQRQAGKVPGVATENADIGVVGIIGAGTMGAGIAMNFIQAGVDVLIMDLKPEFVKKGLEYIQQSYASLVKRKKMKQAVMDTCMSHIKGTSNYSDMSVCDMVVEAVFENMDVKKSVFKSLDENCKPSCLLCTNTSTLDIDEIASATKRPDMVIGTHFFAPANKMMLLEIVRGKHTRPEVIGKVMALSKRIKKVAVVVGNCFGFVGNRIFGVYNTEAQNVLLSGSTVEIIDKAFYDFGLPMGPFTVGDLSGNDIGYKIREGQGIIAKKKENPDLPGYPFDIADRLVLEFGRLGHKTSKGWYDYPQGPRKPVASSEVSKVIAEVRKSKKITPQDFSSMPSFHLLT